ncbi:MAG: isochorismate synthase [Cytophagales bacterium CG12_big_fil_rev_8_21_14_0_65_40_12]|nr:MAG: isochorismate synthase [Cytophagales bacterium CG12_big_fil_rev_8_21_14_0_65_40_12]PIW05184.1 MAG: isochorismate synthase [Cytophagales bacterium CG17_big_fil_post_rev_8_21_14_2_50_40_13]
MNRNEESTLELELQGIELSLALKSILNAAVKMALPVAVWRRPHQSEINVMVSFEKALEVSRLDLEQTEKGFVFSPFHNQDQPTLFLKSDAHFVLSTEGMAFQTSLNDRNDNALQEFFNEVQSFISTNTLSSAYYSLCDQSLSQDSSYLQIVKDAVKAIQDGAFLKVVPARTKHIPIASDFDLIQKYLRLTEAYPNAFVSIVSMPEAGTWLGATPELLLEVDNSIFKTVALAGTQKRNPDKTISDTAWTQKEIEEQAMVSRYIIDCFKKIRLRDFKEKGPKTTIAGNLLHLKTEFEVNMDETNFPELGTVMLELLHPTSAIAGMPKAPALAFLLANEGFERSYYSGFLGPVQIEDQTNLYVNLRCMQLLKDSAILYAGAGVTEDSIPEKELEETELKFNTLLNILNSEN